MRRLYRSKTDRRISGVCGGFGAYWNVDPTLLRIAYIVFAILVGVVPAIILYILAAIVIPEEGDPDMRDPKN